jgi:hypothetical protein
MDATTLLQRVKIKSHEEDRQSNKIRKYFKEKNSNINSKVSFLVTLQRGAVQTKTRNAKHVTCIEVIQGISNTSIVV